MEIITDTPVQLYEPLVVGTFCETLDPYLAYIAYAKGFCDDELIAITDDNLMFKQQAPYLDKNRQPELWVQVFVFGNQHHRQFIDQIGRYDLCLARFWLFVQIIAAEWTEIQTMSPSLLRLSYPPISLSRALIIQQQQKPAELPSFDGYSCWKGKVVGYINRLNNYDDGEIAKIATDHGLYEEPLTIYKK